jgi:hypothetical protein
MRLRLGRSDHFIQVRLRTVCRTCDACRFSPFFNRWPPLFDRYSTVYVRFSPFSRFLKSSREKYIFLRKLNKPRGKLLIRGSAKKSAGKHREDLCAVQHSSSLSEKNSLRIACRRVMGCRDTHTRRPLLYWLCGATTSIPPRTLPVN